METLFHIFFDHFNKYRDHLLIGIAFFTNEKIIPQFVDTRIIGKT